MLYGHKTAAGAPALVSMFQAAGRKKGLLADSAPYKELLQKPKPKTLAYISLTTPVCERGTLFSSKHTAALNNMTFYWQERSEELGGQPAVPTLSAILFPGLMTTLNASVG